MNITKENIMAVKAKGFLLNRGTENFSGRIVSVAGVFSGEDLKTIGEIAEIFGNGTVAFTSRLAAEIVGIPYDKISDAIQYAEERNLHFGGTGAKVRPITACKGTTCVYGNLDTQALAKVLHEKFYIGDADTKMPHKFKIGVGGCPNSCMKPSLNDVGVEGKAEFVFNAELCRGCGKCRTAIICPMKAISVENKKASIDTNKCIKCGLCVGKCPFGAFPGEKSGKCLIYVGGTWGKSARIGTPLPTLYSEEQVPSVIEKVYLWYRENGYVKERLGSAVDRVGVENLIASLATDDLLVRKEEILAAPLKERE